MTNNTAPLYGLILAGGYSKRMGQDKALIDFHGKPQVSFCFDLVSRFCKQVFVSVRADQRYFHLPLLNDLEKFANQGPLGGILSAMENYPDVSWLVLACDLPLVEENTLRFLIAHRETSKIATAFKSAGDQLPEPLCAVWESHAFNELSASFSKGMRCPRKILINSDAHLLNLPDDRWLRNFNSPADLKQFSRETFS